MGGFQVAEAGEDDDLGQGVGLAEAFEEFEAGHGGEIQIEQDDVGGFGLHLAEGLFAGAGGVCFVAPGGDGAMEQIAHAGFVIDDEDLGINLHGREVSSGMLNAMSN